MGEHVYQLKGRRNLLLYFAAVLLGLDHRMKSLQLEPWAAGLRENPAHWPKPVAMVVVACLWDLQ